MSDEQDYIRFFCESCSKKLKARSRCAGRQAPCPKCGRTNTIPGIAPACELLSVEIRFACGACQSRWRIDAELAGTCVNCPKCEARIQVPRIPGPAPASEAPAETAEQDAWTARPSPVLHLSLEEIQFLTADDEGTAAERALQG